MTAPILACDSVWKRFRIPQSPHGTLRGRMLHPLQRTTYHELEALRDISFSVGRGESLGIVGRNGSGKSTLLKIIAGIYRADSGLIDIRGSMAAFIELGVGFNPELSGRDNLFVNGSLLGLTRKELRRRYDAIIEFAELEQFMDMKLRNFSSGMQVRLAFSIANEAGADILITDEVLAVGDANFQEKCFEVFRQRKREGRTVLLVSHDMSAVMKTCDRAILLEEGGIACDASARTTTREYERRVSIAPDVVAPNTAARAKATARPATIEEVWTLDAEGKPAGVLTHGERGSIAMRVRVHRDLVDPIFGLVVADRPGTHAIVTNTKWRDNPTGELAAGAEIVVTFTFDNVLAQGTYTVTPEIAHGDTEQIFESLSDTIEFEVIAPYHSGGVVDPPHEIRIEHLDLVPVS